MKIIDRKPQPSARRTVYQLDMPIPYEVFDKATKRHQLTGRTEFVCVSHGSAGDTIIFASDSNGGILDFMPVCSMAEWNFWKDDDEAIDAWLDYLDSQDGAK